MNLLTKRAWVQPKKCDDEEEQGDKDTMNKRKQKQIEKRQMQLLQRDLKDANDELKFKDQKLEECWVRIKEEVQDKREAQKSLRL